MPEPQVVKAGDVTQRVGVEVISKRGVDVPKLIKILIANAAAEFASTYYYYTILRMHLAGHEDYKEICEDARLEDRAHWELIVPRIYELGGELPNDLPAFHDQAGCEAAKLPNPPTVVNILTLLLESERQPYPAHFNMDRHPRPQPAVYSLTVNGPYAPKGAGDSPSRRR